MTKNSFTDADGRQWVVRITNRTVRDIKDKLGLDVRELLNDETKPLLELLSDSLKLSSIVFVACAEQAKEKGVTEDQFLDAIYGDVGEQMAEAFSVAYIDFFPNPKIRHALSEILGTTRKLMDEIASEASEKVSAAIETTDIDLIAKSFVSRV
jgi:hypothetical protein